MKTIYINISLLLFLWTLSINSSYGNGILNFNVGESPTQTYPNQGITLFGCNGTQYKTDVAWDRRNQLKDNIPYGPRKNQNQKPYFLAKYYVASPPAFLDPNKKSDPHIGLVTPDRFTFKGEHPAQIIDLDYRILEQTPLIEIPVNFQHISNSLPSCEEQGVTSLPINTECDDFPWISGGLGAGGIGELAHTKKKHKQGKNAEKDLQSSSAFLPFIKSKLSGEPNKPLNCQVTLLDDVVLEHKVYFDTESGLTKTINLTEYYKASKTMNLVCLPRSENDIPMGCKAPLN